MKFPELVQVFKMKFPELVQEIKPVSIPSV